MEPKPRITKIVPPKYDSNAPKTNELPKFQRNQSRSAAQRIKNAFHWDDTCEGHYFWLSIYTRLEAIANGEPLK